MRIKERNLINEQEEFELDLSFAEWLDYFTKKPNCKGKDEIEKQTSSNNPNYQPLKGAWMSFVKCIAVAVVTAGAVVANICLKDDDIFNKPNI